MDPPGAAARHRSCRDPHHRTLLLYAGRQPGNLVLRPRRFSAASLGPGSLWLPLLKQGRLSRYVRLFQWEMLQRTSVFEAFVANEPLPAINTADAIVRKFLPTDPSAEDVAIARLWLFQQALIFIRNVEYLARPPLNLDVDEAFVERLIDRLGTLTLSGLGGLATLSAQGRPAA